MHEERLRFMNPSDEKVIAVLHQPAKPTHRAVIVCHGFSGNKDKCYLKDICNALGSAGIAAARIDFSGNGESEGKFEDMTYQKLTGDLRSLIDLLEQKGYTSIGLLGHSMGGSTALLAGAADRRVKAIVNIAGPSDPSLERHKRFVSDYFEKVYGSRESSAKFLKSLEGVDVLGAVRSLNAPLLTIHGDDDQIVPIEEGEAINEAANEPKKMVVLMGKGHRLSEDGELAAECAALSVEWMEKYI